jgi:hypothetical protein
VNRLEFGYRLAMTPSFTKDQRRFAADKGLQADLSLTLGEIARQPFENAALQTHAVKGAQSGVMTSYVGNQQHRVIWYRAGHTAMLLLFDRHDEAYRRAARLKVNVDDEQGIAVREIAETPVTAASLPILVADDQGPLDHWDDALLAEVGFAAHEINLLRDARSESELETARRYLSPDAFELVLAAVSATSEAELRELAGASVGPQAGLAGETKEEDDPPSDLPAEIEARVDAGADGSVVLVAVSDLAEVLGRPIEDWMVFLHPDQRRLVDRRFRGPARVTGGAGTGKTVVGIHRAVRLAREGRQVLFTTYIRTLPGVLATLCERLAPDVTDRITFQGIHAYALKLATRGSVRLDLDQVNAAFDEAWTKVAPAGSRFAELGLGKQYFRDEIAWIIKGRGLTLGDAEAYLHSPRTGRGTAFSQEMRTEIWDLFEFYERRLRARNTIDFDDILRIARDQVREHGDPQGVDAVIVDEAQDLTRVGLELVGAVASNQDDALLLLGDGQQSLYPGGHSLGSVGIDVRGRAAVLRLNYRNTAEIVAVADRIVAGRPFDDGDDDLVVADPVARLDITRSGEAPRMLGFAGVDDHDEAMLVAIEEFAARPDTKLGDIAVLTPTVAAVRAYAGRISGLGLECQKLERYDGRPTAAVKVGTFKRAKGLEFKHVFIPRAEPGMLKDAPLPGEDQPTHAERLDRTRRELYVALTRARDTAWVGWVGEPSALLGR